MRIVYNSGEAQSNLVRYILEGSAASTSCELEIKALINNGEHGTQRVTEDLAEIKKYWDSRRGDIKGVRIQIRLPRVNSANDLLDRLDPEELVFRYDGTNLEYRKGDRGMDEFNCAPDAAVSLVEGFIFDSYVIFGPRAKLMTTDGSREIYLFEDEKKSLEKIIEQEVDVSVTTEQPCAWVKLLQIRGTGFSYPVLIPDDGEDSAYTKSTESLRIFFGKKGRSWDEIESKTSLRQGGINLLRRHLNDIGAYGKRRIKSADDWSAFLSASKKEYDRLSAMTELPIRIHRGEESLLRKPSYRRTTLTSSEIKAAVNGFNLKLRDGGLCGHIKEEARQAYIERNWLKFELGILYLNIDRDKERFDSVIEDEFNIGKIVRNE